MLPRSALLALLGCALASACAGRAERKPAAPPLVLGGRALVDLTHTFDQHTVYWPTESQGFRLTTLHHGPTEAGFFYAANAFAAPEHGGTHLDAPIHFADGRSTAEQIPLERLVGAVLVLDISTRAAKERDTLLTTGDIEAFEAAHGAIQPASLVLVRTGWSRYWPDKKRYLGDDRPGDVSNLHFPGIGREAAEALVARKVGAVGIDTASIDHGPSTDFIAHRILMGADVPAFENLTNLDRLPARGAWLLALPMKIGGGTGAPLRVVAVLP